MDLSHIVSDLAYIIDLLILYAFQVSKGGGEMEIAQLGRTQGNDPGDKGMNPSDDYNI